jgi:hypothetical protein
MADDKSRQSWLILLLAALMGIGVPWLPRGGSAGTEQKGGAAAAGPPATAPSSAPSWSPPTCDERFARPLDAYRPAREAGERAPVERTLVVTVPDPIDAVASYQFDRAVDAIRRAAMALGDQPDRFWLPWSDDRAEETRRGDGEPTGADPPRCHETTPGRMLFRDGEGKLLDVLLVGETATWGVHRPAFARALAEAAGGPGDPIAIAGPTFSGSARSLREEIDRFACARTPGEVSFHVVTGSATAPEVARIMNRGPQACGRIDYASMVPDDQQALDAFLGYLIDVHGFEPAKRDRVRDTDACFVSGVGLLDETGTVYGADVAGSSTLTWSSGCEHEMGSRCRHPRGYGADHPCTGYAPLTLVRYPSQIARLREAHEQLAADPHAAGPRAHALDGSGAAPEGRPTEIVPNLSSATPLSEELVLHQALAEMCRQRLRWVGVLGTDTTDRIFLAREIRGICPDVRLFFVGSDVLYTQPSHGQDLDGSVVVSPYPLVPQNREWTSPFDGVIAPFAGSAAQGLYNAVVQLLTRDPPDPARRRAQIEETPPFRDAGAPPPAPVWITAIGNGDLWPLAVRAPPLDVRELRVGNAAAGWDSSAPLPWIFWREVAVLLAALLSGGYWWGRLFAPPGRPRWGLGWTEVFARSTPGGPSPSRAVAGLLCVAPAALAYGLVGEAVIIELWLRRADRDDLSAIANGGFLGDVWKICGDHPWGGFPMLLVAALLALAVIDVVVAELVPQATRRALVLAADVAILVLGLVGLTVLCPRFKGIFPFADGDPFTATTNAILFHERTANLSSGLSILAPAVLLAAALFLSGYANLRRLRMNLQRDQAQPRDPGSVAFAGDVSLERAGGEASLRLGACLGRFAGTSAGALGAVLVAVVAWSPLREHLGTLEGEAWDGWVWWPCLFVLVAAIGALLAFATGWRRLRSLLELYACTRLGPAFGRVPYHSSKQFGGPLLVRLPEVSELAPLVTRLRWLADRVASPPLQDAACEAERRFAEDTQRVSRPFLLQDGTLSATYAALATAANLLHGHLSEAWAALPSPSGAETPAGDAPSDDGPAARVRVAEELVAALVICRVFHVLVRLRRALTMCTGSLLLLLAAVGSYPFERRPSLLHVVAAAVLVTAGVALGLFLEMERNEVLSRIHRTTPGEVDWSSPLVLKIVLYAGVPLLGVAAASFPTIGREAFGWVTPLLQLLQ